MSQVSCNDVQDILLEEPKAVLQKHGKSFYFASIFLGSKQLAPIAELYAVCRYIDDCADEQVPEIAKKSIRDLKNTFDSDSTRVEPFSTLADKLVDKGVHSSYLKELLEGAQFDLEYGSIENREQLLRYCYLVAGVVGLMMCPLLGASDDKAKKHATDLGIGMQLTNICRDILEDFNNGRVYLPELQAIRSDLEKEKLSTEIRSIIEAYLDLADEFYASGYRGLAYLPLRARFVILVAGELYRHIGVSIRNRDFDVFAGRVFLSTYQKTFVAIKSLAFFFKISFWVPGTYTPPILKDTNGKR